MTITRRRLALALALAATVAIALWAGLRRRGRDSEPTRDAVTPTSGGRLDVSRFRERLAQRRARAKAFQSRPSTRGKGVSKLGSLGSSMLSPRCILGPADLCDAIASTVADCDAGDGSACLAVGQYLEDAPPRPLIVMSFYFYACKHGEQAGCDRRDALKAPAADPPTPCADDPMACAWQGSRAKDPARLDQACAHGVADACAWMAHHHEADPARARVYFEAGCELGSPLVCDELARRLSPDCDEDCYPSDPAAALAAATIACEVGFDDACARLPR